MNYGIELDEFLRKQFIFEATLEKNRVWIFSNSPIGKINISTSFHFPITRIYQRDYYKIPIFHIGKTTH